MTFNPTPTQALLLFGLLARHGECAQAELMPEVKKADREALVRAKLIAVEKIGRGLKLLLADEGWAWMPSHLNAELPPAQRTLSDFLIRLTEYLARNRGDLANFIGEKPKEDSRPKPIKTKSPEALARAEAKAKAADEKKRLAEEKKTQLAQAKQAKTRQQEAKRTTAGKKKVVAAERKRDQATAKQSPKRKTSPAIVRKRIESAYLAITNGRKNESVRLAHLRAKLADLDRATIDAELGRILKGDKKASLMRHDDPNQIDRADHDAAFNPSGEPFHVLWIAP